MSVEPEPFGTLQRVLRRPAVIFGAAVLATIAAFALLQWQASRTTAAAGFWYEAGPFMLPDTAAAEIGGPLSDAELESIKKISRLELARALAGLPITLTEDRNAFWNIAVRPSLERSRSQPLPYSGEAYGLGPLGGGGSVSFVTLALNAIKHALPVASRPSIIEGMGRGIGSAAAHELAHVILGVSVDNRTDEDSYEYFSADRASQYYGELHWTAAWPLLRQKLGHRGRVQ